MLKFRKEDEAESAPANSGAGGGVDRITLEEVEKVSVRLDKKKVRRERGAEAEEVRKEKRDKENAAPAAGKVIAQQEPYGRDSEAIRQFRRTIAGYYQMEEENVEIGLED